MNIEEATQEVSKWLDCKKINEKKRDVYASQIETLVDGFVDGILELDSETKKITHNLKFPLEDDKGVATVSKIVYKPRMRVSEPYAYLQGVKSSDADGRVNAYIAALTEQSTGIIKKLDTEDYAIASSIVVFFA